MQWAGKIFKSEDEKTMAILKHFCLLFLNSMMTIEMSFIKEKKHKIRFHEVCLRHLIFPNFSINIMKRKFSLFCSIYLQFNLEISWMPNVCERRQWLLIMNKIVNQFFMRDESVLTFMHLASVIDYKNNLGPETAHKKNLKYFNEFKEKATLTHI